jgi:hypothetical protein
MRLIVFIILFFISFFGSKAQSGITFFEFAEKIQSYFDDTMIGDVKAALPQGNDFTIWGWDVGDYSGDKINDLAFAIYIRGEKERKVKVFHFIDIDGYLRKVNEESYSFVEIPLEVGIVIKENKCFVTSKAKQYNWKMFSYNYENGVFSLVEEFETQRRGKITFEKSRNYRTLKCYERYLNTKDSKILYTNDYMLLPAYNRGRKIYKGESYDYSTSSINYVISGSYYWKGEEDFSIIPKANYDEQFLYLSINFRDDSVVPFICDTCKSDEVDILFDLNPYYKTDSSYIIDKNEKLSLSDIPERGIIKLKVNPGNFKEILPMVEVKSNELLDITQKAAIKLINASSNYTNNGYNIKLRIPFEFLTIDYNDIQKGDVNIGLVLTAQDIDNEFRPEEVTYLTNSNLNTSKPFTFGKLTFIPSTAKLNFSENILIDSLVKELNNYGF